MLEIGKCPTCGATWRAMTTEFAEFDLNGDRKNADIADWGDEMIMDCPFDQTTITLGGDDHVN